MRGSDFRELLYERQNRLVKWWMRLRPAAADSMAVMGESLRWLFEGLIPPERIAVVPNGTPDLGLGEPERRRGRALPEQPAPAQGRRPVGGGGTAGPRGAAAAEFRFVGGWEARARARAARPACGRPTGGSASSRGHRRRKRATLAERRLPPLPAGRARGPSAGRARGAGGRPSGGDHRSRRDRGDGDRRRDRLRARRPRAAELADASSSCCATRSAACAWPPRPARGTSSTSRRRRPTGGSPSGSSASPTGPSACWTGRPAGARPSSRRRRGRASSGRGWSGAPQPRAPRGARGRTPAP